MKIGEKFEEEMKAAFGEDTAALIKKAAVEGKLKEETFYQQAAVFKALSMLCECAGKLVSLLQK